MKTDKNIDMTRPKNTIFTLYRPNQNCERIAFSHEASKSLSKQVSEKSDNKDHDLNRFLEYQIDFELLKKVERLYLYGYKKEHLKVIDWLAKKSEDLNLVTEA